MLADLSPLVTVSPSPRDRGRSQITRSNQHGIDFFYAARALTMTYGVMAPLKLQHTPRVGVLPVTSP